MLGGGFFLEVHYLGFGFLLIVLGFMIGFLALKKNQLGNFNIRPDLRDDCVLITDGIYRYIRHPMYTSVLTIMLGVACIYLSWYEIVLFLVLLSNFIVKLFYEESLWHCESEAYHQYSQKTARLIPFIF
jgi:protein-S-isoprenylcysteine O-methyltransferase Ste14